jgi:hypothetical protein
MSVDSVSGDSADRSLVDPLGYEPKALGRGGLSKRVREAPAFRKAMTPIRWQLSSQFIAAEDRCNGDLSVWFRVVFAPQIAALGSLLAGILLGGASVDLAAIARRILSVAMMQACAHGNAQCADADDDEEEDGIDDLFAMLLEALQHRQAEMAAEIMETFGELCWFSIWDEKGVDMRFVLNDSLLDLKDAGAVWLAVCNACGFSHPLLPKAGARRSGRKRSRGNHKKKRGKCYRCRKSGHLAQNCDTHGIIAASTVARREIESWDEDAVWPASIESLVVAALGPASLKREPVCSASTVAGSVVAGVSFAAALRRGLPEAERAGRSVTMAAPQRHAVRSARNAPVKIGGDCGARRAGGGDLLSDFASHMGADEFGYRNTCGDLCSWEEHAEGARARGDLQEAADAQARWNEYLRWTAPQWEERKEIGGNGPAQFEGKPRETAKKLVKPAASSAPVRKIAVKTADAALKNTYAAKERKVEAIARPTPLPKRRRVRPALDQDGWMDASQFSAKSRRDKSRANCSVSTSRKISASPSATTPARIDHDEMKSSPKQAALPLAHDYSEEVFAASGAAVFEKLLGQKRARGREALKRVETAAPAPQSPQPHAKKEKDLVARDAMRSERAAHALPLTAVAQNAWGKPLLISDSGATHSVHAGTGAGLCRVEKLPEAVPVFGINETAEPIKIEEGGVRVYANGYAEHCYISPEASLGVSSVPQATANGFWVLFTQRLGSYMRLKPGVSEQMANDAIMALFDVDVQFNRDTHTGLYALQQEDSEENSAVFAARVLNDSHLLTESEKAELLNLHAALGHAGARAMKEHIQRYRHLDSLATVRDIKFTRAAFNSQVRCDSCSRANTKAAPRKSAARYAQPLHPMEHVCFDASGLLRWDFAASEPRVKWLWENSNRFQRWDRFAVFVCVYSQFLVVNGFRAGQSIGEWYRNTIAWGMRQSGHATKHATSDLGSENRSLVLQNYFKENGIEWRPAPVGDKQLNGQAEVYMGILVPRAAAMCVHANLHAFFLIFALLECARVLNDMPARAREEEKSAEKDKADDDESAGTRKTRAELFYGRSIPTNGVPPIFGSDAYILVNPHKQAMLKSQTKQFGKRHAAIYVGHDPLSPQMLLYLVVDDVKPYFVSASQGEIYNGRFEHGRADFHYGRRRRNGKPAPPSAEKAREETPGKIILDGVRETDDGEEESGSEDEMPLYEVNDGDSETPRALENTPPAPAANEEVEAPPAHDEKKMDKENESEDDFPQMDEEEELENENESDEVKDETKRDADDSKNDEPPSEDDLSFESALEEENDDAEMKNDVDETSSALERLPEAPPANEESALRRSGRTRRPVEKPGFVHMVSQPPPCRREKAPRALKNLNNRKGTVLSAYAAGGKWTLSDDDHWARLSMQFIGMPDPKAKRAGFKARYNSIVSETVLPLDFVFSIERKEFSMVTLPGPQNAREFYNLNADELLKFNIAKKKEEDALIANGTFELVPESSVPRSARIMDSRYVWTKKVNELSEKIYKARLVAKDIRFGAVLDGNYSPVVASKSVRVILALCALFDMSMFQVDLNNAFLHAALDGDVYVRFPKGYERMPGADGMVMKLKKSLYGLQEAPKRWYETLTAFMAENDWKTTPYDPCLFFRQTPNGGVMILGLHVDDQLGGTTQHPEDVKWLATFMNKLEKKFGIKGPKEPTYALGLDIARQSDGSIFLSQHTFVQKMLEEFGMLNNGFPASAAEPNNNGQLLEKERMAANFKRKNGENKLRMGGNKDEKGEGGEVNLNNTDKRNRNPDFGNGKPFERTTEWYRQAVGSLLYATHTRPDIAHAVNLLARLLPNDHTIDHSETDDERLMEKRERNQRRREKEKQLAFQRLQEVCGGLAPYEAMLAEEESEDDLPLTKDAFDAVNHLFRYLRSTRRYGLLYRGSGKRGVVKQSDVGLRIQCFTDSDFMGDPTDGKSTSGFVIKLNGSVIHWSSKKQLSVTRSTCGAEYVAMAQGIDEVMWLKEMLTAMGFRVETPICVWGDNDANNSIVNGVQAVAAARNVNNAYHFIREMAVKKRMVSVHRVDTQENIADIFTKTLRADKFALFRDRLVCTLPVSEKGGHSSA